MSCQQASRFHPATTATAAAALARNTATKRIATAAAVAISTAAAATAATLTPGESVAGKTTTEDSDPYAFTETVSVAPPILFNAQKSRARLSENNNKSNRKSNNRKLAATAGASNRKATLAAQLNATAAAVAAAAAATATATAKAQASLATITTATATTNFNNVTQSQRQQPALSPAQLPLQAQASPKRATNVCIVRPQQQQQEKLAAEACQQPPTPPTPPPPLYSHTPSLWQTPLILDISQKQQQPQPQHPYQQQQNHHQLQAVSIALASPPTSPASLPSPTLTPTAAVTAMVSPIVSPKGGLPLPPSKFHHTTLAQHLQKVECLKKKKSLPLTCQNNNNNNKQHNHMVESLNKTIGTGTTTITYNLTQPPPLTVFNTGTVQAAAPPPAAAAPPQKQKHSTSTLDDSDLNEIPVNVIFRKPPVLMAGTGVGGVAAGAAAPAGQAQPNGVKMLLPTPPATPPEVTTPPLLAHRLPSSKASTPVVSLGSALRSAGTLLVVSGGSTPAAATQATSSLHTPLNPPVNPAASIKSEKMSSKVANANAAVNANAAPKRQTPGAGGRRGNNNKTNNAASVAKKNLASKPPPPQDLKPNPIVPPIPIADKTEPALRQRRRKAASKRYSATINENETTENATDSPYCLQQHWMHTTGRDMILDFPLSPSNRREERIAVRKGMLRRQALQLQSTRSLQDLPVRAARQRLQCVQNMLVKYQDHAGQQQSIGIGHRCLVSTCKQPTLTMAAHCERHIVNNSTQQLFQPCAAWLMDGTACLAPVFDVLHTLPLCTIHSHLRAGLEKVRPMAKLTAANLPLAVATPAAAVPAKRKRKANPNPVSRPQKRGRKPNTEQQMSHQISRQPTTLPVMQPVVMQRKSSTTSLESIASNSQCSSVNSHSQLSYTPLTPTPTPTQTFTPAPVPVSVPAPPGLPHLSIPPALAPLSGDYQPKQQQQHQQQQHQALFKFEADPHVQQLESGLNMLASANINIKAEEINQIVAQLAAAGGDLQPQSNLHNNNNNSLHFNNNNMSYSNNNSFPSFNAAFGNAIGQPTHNGHQTALALANTANLLGQDMFGICENSSAYASSEDTGLGGLSESELIGANDADDIALNGAHLLEEHDLVNVFDTLPDDAFNELFQSVQQAECEAMDRALEIADKNLKCLQQTIVGSEDSDLLSDFLDDMLADGVISSTNTSGIDAATLFVDSSSGGGTSSSNSANSSCTPASASVADIRGLVQT
ncbi:uncharacterized protein LOC108156099 [Drosophila miranda]|uniref:uncharacterized protein LOC108156099 n=1 Tax=Drosophila miranda TaxID=7229 RepID=UPI0007E87531|nr:uncharacterized protein LOC108156099 [Drosophila miranda]XP_017142878.1 uncharacterized protein LOC108156099 [Drosophila miranda]XP_033245215.1 uncharacterized protein LOC108156099 [Drosophila miranda]